MTENWLVQISDSSGSNPKYFSFFDQTVNSIAYVGAILNVPTIRESIDIFKSKSSLSNVSIELDNSSSISSDLVFGSNNYINRTVKIYSCLETGTVANMNNVPLLYTGRLESLSHDEKSISLSITAINPWDMIEVPNVYSNEKVLAPIAYGDFTGNSSSYTGVGTNNWRPVPFTKADAVSSHFVTGDIADSTMSNYTSQYVATRDSFVPFSTRSSGTSTVGSVQNITIGVNGKYIYYTTPASDTQSSSHSSWSVSATEDEIQKSYDLDANTYARYQYTETVSAAQDRYHVHRYTIPETEEGTQIVLSYTIADYSRATNVSLLEVTPTLETEVDSITGTTHNANQFTVQTLTLITTNPTTYIDLKIRAQTDVSGSGGAAAVTLRAIELSISNLKNKDDIKKVYVDIDGYVKSWESGVATKLHEFHRDLFHRFLGITSVDSTSWNALNSAKSAWVGRFWLDKGTSIKQVLDKCGYEGGFCSSAEHALDKNDLSNIKISHKPIGDLLTDVTVNYDPHPAKPGDYRSQATASDSTTRTAYNIPAKEGKTTYQLDILKAVIGSDITGGSNDPNDGFIEYYGNLKNKPRVVMNASIINPAFFDMELGDICTFSSMIPVKAFNNAFSSKYFMVTSLTRKSGKLQAKFVDVTPA
jgi:hypothetical protein